MSGNGTGNVWKHYNNMEQLSLDSVEILVSGNMQISQAKNAEGRSQAFKALPLTSGWCTTTRHQKRNWWGSWLRAQTAWSSSGHQAESSNTWLTSLVMGQQMSAMRSSWDEASRHRYVEMEKDQHPGGIGHTFGINRRDALQAAGPLPLQIDKSEEDLRQAEDELRAATMDYELRFSQDKVDLDTVETLSKKLSQATRSWFEDGLHSECGLLTEWCKAMQVGASADDAEIVLLAWGCDILPDIWATWESGTAEGIAEKAFYEIIKEKDIYRMDQAINKAREKVRRIQVDRQDDVLSRPHRPVQRGPRYRRGGNKTVRPITRRYRDGDQWHQAWSQSALVNGVADVELPFYKQIDGRKVYLVLHLFSGRRRSKDFHDYLMAMSDTAPFDIRILSLDTAVDQDVGNLQSGGKTWTEVDRLLRGGHVAAGMAGVALRNIFCSKAQPTPRRIVGQTEKKMA